MKSTETSSPGRDARGLLVAPRAVAQRWDAGGWQLRLLIFKFASSPGDSVTLWLPTSCRTAHTMLLVSPTPLPRTEGNAAPGGLGAALMVPRPGQSALRPKPAQHRFWGRPSLGRETKSSPCSAKLKPRVLEYVQKKGKKVAFTPGTQWLAGWPLRHRIPPPPDLEGGP